MKTQGMLRALQNLPKVLRGHVPCGSSRSNLPQNPSSVLNENTADKRSGCDYKLCARLPGHIKTYPSWVPGRQWHVIFGCFDGSRGNASQRQQWQSHRNQHSEFEAFHWGTAVVVAIQLCRALSCAKFPNQEHRADIQQSFLKVAKLLPIPPSLNNTARKVISHGGDSCDESKSFSSVSFSTDDAGSGSNSDESSSSSGSEALGRASDIFDEPVSGYDDKKCTGDTLKWREHSTDQILPALEGALLKLNQTSQKIQGMIETMMGIQYASLGNQEKAAAHFETASRLGYSKAQYNLGQCYELGKGVQVDIGKAIDLYEKAAEQDHPLALYKLGSYHYHGIGGIVEDKSTGVDFMQRAASFGVILAHSFLGNYYLQAKSRDLHKAIFHLRAAVEEQETESEYLLGLCYEQGWGVHRNLRKAARLYHKAAEGGYPLAMYSLGLYYEKGLGGVLQDKTQAKQLYTDSSKRGLALATERLRQLRSLEEAERKQGEDKTERRSIVTSENTSVKDLKASNGAENTSIHLSNSEPCLPSREESQTSSYGESSVTLSYLSLILPSILRTNNSTGGRGSDAGHIQENQVNFHIGADEDSNISSWKMEPVQNVQLTV